MMEKTEFLKASGGTGRPDLFSFKISDGKRPPEELGALTFSALKFPMASVNHSPRTPT
jgi:hypothetical protein